MEMVEMLKKYLEYRKVRQLLPTIKEIAGCLAEVQIIDEGERYNSPRFEIKKRIYSYKDVKDTSAVIERLLKEEVEFSAYYRNNRITGKEIELNIKVTIAKGI
jgi:hypothetical protein